LVPGTRSQGFCFFLDGFNDAVELVFAGFLLLAFLLLSLLGLRSPGLLFRGVEAPNNDVASAPPVVVPGCVPGSVAFGVGAAAKEAAEGRFKLGEEDEVVGPFVWGV
jgi:hypothetical protein